MNVPDSGARSCRMWAVSVMVEVVVRFVRVVCDVVCSTTVGVVTAFWMLSSASGPSTAALSFVSSDTASLQELSASLKASRSDWEDAATRHEHSGRAPGASSRRCQT